MKILKEKTRKEFEEIKSKKQDEEQVEQEEIENQEDFSDSENDVNFADVINPVLESSGQSQGSIEQVVEDAPSTTSNSSNNTRGEDTKYNEIVAYNMPDYGSVYEQIEETGKRDRETNVTMLAPRQEVREEKRVNFGEWRREMVDSSSSPNHEDYTVRMRRVQEDSGMPFDDKKKRRLNI